MGPGDGSGARGRRRDPRLDPVAPNTITAVLGDGPMDGRKVDADVVEGRPPKTLDLPADDGSTCRYVLAEWTQSGHSAVYEFLYVV